jgi:pentatricopeptide repeat protein
VLTSKLIQLLLDCHGTIAPIDIKTMEKTFAQLVNDKRVTVQGSHWAALINAHGCVNKDLNKAIAVFNSIEKHPSTLISRAHLPDAVVFEALINVFVTLRRTDLVPTYLERLQQSGVHMTAYIANLLIRGYAAVGNIEDARKVFESLADPPVGVAAPHNHAPHDSSVPPRVSPNELVYREVSTVRVNLLNYANVLP